MNNLLSSIFVILVLSLSIFMLSSLYIVPETQQVLITQFGKPIGSSINTPGLKFKLPWQKANFFEKRLLEWDGEPKRIPTIGKRNIWIDTTARWRIVDPLLFLQSVRDENGAHLRLDGVLNGTIRNEIGASSILEIVRTSNRIFDVSTELIKENESQRLKRLVDGRGREQFRLKILERAKPKVSQYGIELVDIRIKRVNYESEVRQKVFARMISEREQVADKLRSEGEAEKARIEGLKEKEIKRIESEAYREAQVIRGKADAEAINIYAKAYNNDPEFYSFLKTLETYKNTLDKDTTLILGTDNDYFKHLKEITV